MPQPEFDGIDAGRRGELVHERFVRVSVLHPAGCPDPRRPERRRLEPMADGVDVGERIGRRRILEDVAGIQRRFSRQVGQRRGHEGHAFGDERDLGDPELRLPGDNVAGRVEPSGDVDERRRALGIPAVLVVPHPLHAHGPSHLAREQRGVGGRVLVAVAAIATGAVEVETADLVGRHAERHGQVAAQQVRGLGRRPHRELIVFPFRDRARRPDGAVGVDGELVGGLEPLGRAGESGLGITLVDRDLVFVDRRGTDVLVELAHLGQAFPRRPRRRQLARRLHGRPLAVGHHGQEVRLAHDLPQSLDPAHRRLVDAPKLGADGRRPHDARVEHAGHPHVLHVPPLAGDLRRDVDARHRRTNDGVLAGALERRGLVDLQVELAIPDELAVGDALSRIGLDANHAVPDLQRVRRDAEPLSRLLEQCLARRGRRLADLDAADLDRQAAPRRALIRRRGRVAFDERDPVERHVELLGNDLTERRARARSEVDLARVNRHAAGRRQGKEAVHLVERDRLGRRHRLGARLGQWTGQAERDDERARAFEEIPARRRSVEHR